MLDHEFGIGEWADLFACHWFAVKYNSNVSKKERNIVHHDIYWKYYGNYIKFNDGCTFNPNSKLVKNFEHI